jgi:hypothetical protein
MGGVTTPMGCERTRGCRRQGKGKMQQKIRGLLVEGNAAHGSQARGRGLQCGKEARWRWTKEISNIRVHFSFFFGICTEGWYRNGIYQMIAHLSKELFGSKKKKKKKNLKSGPNRDPFKPIQSHTKPYILHYAIFVDPGGGHFQKTSNSTPLDVTLDVVGLGRRKEGKTWHQLSFGVLIVTKRTQIHHPLLS